MNINRENFEAYYLDFLEGNLERNKIVELQSFLARNPDIQIKNDSLEIYLNTIEQDCISYENKYLLKDIGWNETEISDENIINFQLARLDQLLSLEKEKELRLFEEKFPQWKKENELLFLTRLNPDGFVVYDKKTLLKKPFIQKRTTLLFSIVSSAACITLFLMLRNNVTENQVILTPNTKNAISKGNESKTNLIDSISRKKFFSENKKKSILENKKTYSPIECTDEDKDSKTLPLNNSYLSENKEPTNQPDSIFIINPIEHFHHQSNGDENLVEITEASNIDLAEKNTEIETRKFALFSKLLAKYLNIHFGVGKKVRQDTDEYYVYIGSFQVSRKISK